MSPPWLTLETLPHFYVRRPAADCLILAGPRRKAAAELVDALRGIEGLRASFCGYLLWWMFRGGEREVTLAHQAIELSLRPWRLPDAWMRAAVAEADQACTQRSYKTTPDGYRAWMPRDANLIQAIRDAQIEFGDDAHLEWSASGFDWILRRKALHRRARAMLGIHGFRARSPVLSALREKPEHLLVEAA